MSEIYEGVKFKTIFTGNDVPKDERLIQLKHWAMIFAERNLAPSDETGSAGNLSFRINKGENQFIITGSKIELKNALENDSFVTVTNCDIEKGIVYAKGIREPSSESMLHYAIYKQRPYVNAVFHGHCDEILNATEKLMLPETLKYESYGTLELINSVTEILGKESFIIMKNHGFLAIAGSVQEAGYITLRIHNETKKKL
ncbi:MAG: class II aldolase/adducin family protein [Bacteroidia bacterium]|nr:class II aldolase/adducin family protein [Bacteroidia bacterium]